MEHNMHMVDILSSKGAIVGTKRRIDILKPQDIYHTIHVLLITPRGEIVASTIPVREDLPNLYAGKLGTTVATIRRSHESAFRAGQRAVSRELFIDNIQLNQLGEGMFRLAPDRLNYITAYYAVSEATESYSLLDIDSLVIVGPRDIDNMIKQNPDDLADSFVAIWRKYRGRLPI